MCVERHLLNVTKTNDTKNMSLSLFCKEYCMVELILEIISNLATLFAKKKKSFIHEVN